MFTKLGSDDTLSGRDLKDDLIWFAFDVPTHRAARMVRPDPANRTVTANFDLLQAASKLKLTPDGGLMPSAFPRFFIIFSLKVVYQLDHAPLAEN